MVTRGTVSLAHSCTPVHIPGTFSAINDIGYNILRGGVSGVGRPSERLDDFPYPTGSALLRVWTCFCRVIPTLKLINLPISLTTLFYALNTSFLFFLTPFLLLFLTLQFSFS